MRSRPGFRVPDDEVRFAFGRTFYLQTGWTVFVGVALLAMPSARFANPSWAFINEIPGADNTVGAIYLAAGAAMATALRCDCQRSMAVALGVAGVVNWSLGVALLLPTLLDSTGAIGFALALYPGAHMLSTSVTLWHRRVRR